MRLKNSTLQDKQKKLYRPTSYIAVGMRYKFLKNPKISKFQKFLKRLRSTLWHENWKLKQCYKNSNLITKATHKVVFFSLFRSPSWLFISLIIRCFNYRVTDQNFWLFLRIIKILKFLDFLIIYISFPPQHWFW